MNETKYVEVGQAEVTIIFILLVFSLAFTVILQVSFWVKYLRQNPFLENQAPAEDKPAEDAPAPAQEDAQAGNVTLVTPHITKPKVKLAPETKNKPVKPVKVEDWVEELDIPTTKPETLTEQSLPHE